MAIRTSSSQFEEIELGQSESQVEEERRIQAKRREKIASRRHWVIVFAVIAVFLLIGAIVIGDSFGEKGRTRQEITGHTITCGYNEGELQQ